MALPASTEREEVGIGAARPIKHTRTQTASIECTLHYSLKSNCLKEMRWGSDRTIQQTERSHRNAGTLREAPARVKRKGAFRPRGSEGGARRPLLAPCPSRGRTRPARARRPVLPRTGSAVLWAMAGLAAEFGMGSGDPRLRGRARAGRPLRFPSGTSRAPWRPHSVVRETSSSRDRPPRGIRGSGSKSSGY